MPSFRSVSVVRFCRVAMSSLSRSVIKTSKAPTAIGPYSQGISVDNTVYVSGQLGLDPDTMNFVSDEVEAQTRQSIRNISAILEAVGLTLNNVVKTTVLLADMDDFAKVNAVYAEYFQNPYPARAAFQVACLPKSAKVEIEAVAVAGGVETS